MKSTFIRPQSSVCRFCSLLSVRYYTRPRSLRPAFNTQCVASFSNSVRAQNDTNLVNRADAIQRRPSVPRNPSRPISTPINPQNLKSVQVKSQLRDVVMARDQLLAITTIPSEEEILKVLEKSATLAANLVRPTEAKTKDSSETSALLSLNKSVSRDNTPKTPKQLSPEAKDAINQLSDINLSILVHPPIFITPQILRQYVEMQATMGKPESFPIVFDLFATKPIPREGSSPIQYMKQKPNKVSNAIPKSVADHALQAATRTRNLQVAMDIVDTTYATTAFQRAKGLRQLLVPGLGALGLPLALYIAAGQLSQYQATMEPSTATNLAFTAMLTYVGCLATIGMVVITTSNDQMERVTWAPGLPLRERWFREEERAAIDRMACAWGFREKWRRGEEEGPDWDALRQWIGMKGMILDQVDFMEGME